MCHLAKYGHITAGVGGMACDDLMHHACHASMQGRLHVDTCCESQSRHFANCRHCEAMQLQMVAAKLFLASMSARVYALTDTLSMACHQFCHACSSTCPHLFIAMHVTCIAMHVVCMASVFTTCCDVLHATSQATNVVTKAIIGQQ